MGVVILQRIVCGEHKRLAFKMVYKSLNDKKVISALRKGGIGVIPTDTIYGIVGSALSEEAVTRIYKLRRRNLRKPMIVLISSLADLARLGVHWDARMKKILSRLWPGKASVILPCRPKKFSYLHRGKKTLALRLPAKKSLRVLIKSAGPLVAPSANIEGRPPARTIREAEKYFRDRVDFYVDGGKLSSKPSTLVELKNGNLIVLRKGAVRF